MKILYSKVNIIHIRCDGRYNTKEQCSCISNVVPSKTEWVGKKVGIFILDEKLETKKGR